MRIGLTLKLFLALGVVPFTATAAERPDDAEFNFEFTYTNPGGGSTDIPDFSVRTYALAPTLPAPDPTWTIDYLEFEVAGLTHASPGDVNIFLADPYLLGGGYGSGIEVIDDSGDGFGLQDTTLLFTDFWGLGIALPDHTGQLLPYPDTIYWPLEPGKFTDYETGPVGVLPWFAVVIDDFGQGEGGGFTQLTLRGIAVPEPATLSLLTLGALATLYRRRR